MVTNNKLGFKGLVLNPSKTRYKVFANMRSKKHYVGGFEDSISGALGLVLFCRAKRSTSGGAYLKNLRILKGLGYFSSKSVQDVANNLILPNPDVVPLEYMNTRQTIPTYATRDSLLSLLGLSEDDLNIYISTSALKPNEHGFFKFEHSVSSYIFRLKEHYADYVGCKSRVVARTKALDHLAHLFFNHRYSVSFVDIEKSQIVTGKYLSTLFLINLKEVEALSLSNVLTPEAYSVNSHKRGRLYDLIPNISKYISFLDQFQVIIL